MKPDSDCRPALVFFLGGRDLEMLTIRQMLESAGAEVHDQGLAWGARASSYRAEIEASLERGKTPVLIELEPDLRPDHLRHCRVVDHHGKLAGKDAPTSLEQVHALLGSNAPAWSRWHSLVAANDRGYVPALRGLNPPASDSEIHQVRKADLAAQGVAADELVLARKAAETARQLCGGRLTVVTTDIRGGLVAEMLERFWGGPGFANLLVVGPEKVSFFGDGNLVQLLADASPPSPSSWFGGALPDSGFWGAMTSEVEFDPLALLTSELGSC